MRIQRLLLPVALAGLLLAACGDEDTTEPAIVLDGNNTNNATNNANNGTNNANNGGNNANNVANNGGNNANNGGNNVTPRGDIDVIFEETLEVAGDSMTFDFEVPDDAVSVTVSVVGSSPYFYTLNQWTQGDGVDVVTQNWISSDEGSPQLCLGCAQRVTAAEGAFAALMPGHPGVELVPGTHTVKVYAFERSQFNFMPYSGQVDVWVLAKRAPAEPTTGVLDVNLFFTGADGLTAETAQTDADFQKVLDDVNFLYEQANIELGNITYNDIDERFQVIEDAGQPGSDLNEMFKLSANAPPGVNIFFCDDLAIGGQFGGFGVLLGIAGNIPGPAWKNGTPRSGVALALKRTPEAPTPLFKVFAHEVGHFLGLYHTSEQNLGFGPRIHDQLTDTGEDDLTLLMHAQGSGNTLTESQGQVMRLNPWVRHEGGQ